MPSLRWILTVGLVAPLCGQARPLPHPLETTPEFDTAIAAGTRTATGRPGANAWTDYAHYVIDAELVPELCLVRGHVAMTYHNRSPDPLEDLVIHLRQNLHAPTARRNIEVLVTGGMQVERLMLAGKEAPYFLDGTVLTIQLRDELPSGSKTTVEMDFSFEVPNGEAPRMGREGRELFFLGYWYPQFAVHDDVDGWVAEQYLGGSEFYMPYADYEVAFTVPEGFLVQATGTLQNADDVLTDPARAALEKALTSDKPVSIVDADALAAGKATRPGKGGRLTWRFTAKNVRDFAISTANCYVWDAVRANGGDGHCLVQTLYRPEAKSWRLSARHARHAIEWMSQHVMPYPWPHATVVEGVLGGGMEYPMITLCGDQMSPVALQGLIAHELGHMWFPMMVGSNEKAHVWQDEGIVDFFTELMEASYWKREQTGQRTIGMYLSMAATGEDREPLLRHSDRLVDQSNYYIVGYTKPAALLHQLAGVFGRNEVVAAIADYARAWRYSHPQPIDFFRSMNASLHHDLDWYWSCYWAETWTLDHAIAEVREVDGQTEVVIEDRGRAFLPATVQVTYDNGEVVERIVPASSWLEGKRKATLSFGARVVRVVVDPRHQSLDLDSSNNKWTRKEK